METTGIAVAQIYPRDGAPISLETRVPISLAGVRGVRTSEGALFLRPGKIIRTDAAAPEPLTDVNWRLRLIGEVDIEPEVHSEMRFDALYRIIDDALDRETTRNKPISLTMQSEGEAFPRRAHWRAVWNQQAPARDYDLTIWAKATQRYLKF